MATIANGNSNQNQSGGKKHSKTEIQLKIQMPNFKISVVVVVTVGGVCAVRIVDITINRAERTYQRNALSVRNSATS